MMIAKEQNLTKAAQKLYLTQPALSKFLKEKEQSLGVHLFERIENKYVPTYAGRMYIEKGVEILDLKKKLDAEISALAKNNEGELRIAYPIMRGSYLIHKTLPQFSKLYPNVKVIIKEENSGFIENMLIHGEVDIVFFNTPIEGKDLTCESICMEDLVLVTPPDHPAQKYAINRPDYKYHWIDIHHFQNDRFIMQLHDQRGAVAAKQAFDSVGFAPSNVMTLRNIGATVRLATQGYGLCVVSDIHPLNMEGDVKPLLFSIGDPPVKMEFVAVYRKNSHLTDYARKYIEIVRDAAVSMGNL